MHMVCGESTFQLLALPTASLAAVVIPPENRIAPSQVPFVLESLPRPSSLPVRVIGTAQNGAAFKLCTAGLGNRLGGHSSAASLCGESRSLLRRKPALSGVGALNLTPVLRILVKLQPGSPVPNAANADAIEPCEVSVRGRWIELAKSRIHATEIGPRLLNARLARPVR
jgi:hypothetical protein